MGRGRLNRGQYGAGAANDGAGAAKFALPEAHSSYPGRNVAKM